MTAALSRMLADAPRDGEQLEEHHGRVPDRVHPTLRRIDPAGRHLDDLVAGALGAVEHLDVEPEAASLQHWEHLVRDLRGEGLESALGIMDPAKHEDPNQAVEELPHRLPVPGLVQLDL